MGIVKDYERMCSDIGKSLKGFLRSCPSDVSLLVEGKKLPVHKFVLSARSKYFDTLFSLKEGLQDTEPGSRGFKRKQLGDVSQSLVEIEDSIISLTNNVIEIRNVKLEVVKGVLEYFYEGHYDCHENVDTHFQALELARQFNLKSLEEILIGHLVKSITMRNFTDFFNLNIRYENVKLKKTCNDFLEGNGEEITASDNFSKLTFVSLLSVLDSESFGADEIDIFCAAERWAGVNKPNKETVKDIVGKMRFETMSQKDLFHVVECSKKLPSIDILDVLRSMVVKDAASTNFRRRQQQRNVTSPNKALASRGATVTGGYTGGDCDPMNCIDGDENKWAEFSVDFPLTITLGHPYWLSSLRVNIFAGDNSYTIDSSPDGESWQPVGGETEGEEADVWRIFQFSRRVVLHFRVTMKKIVDGDWIELIHFESPASTTAVTN